MQDLAQENVHPRPNGQLPNRRRDAPAVLNNIAQNEDEAARRNACYNKSLIITAIVIVFLCVLGFVLLGVFIWLKWI